MTRNFLPDFGWRSWLGSFLLLAQFLFASAAFAQATSTADRYFNSATEARNACTAEPQQFVCGNGGQLYQSGCNSIETPHGGGGLWRVTRVEMSKPAGMGACYYSNGASLKYTYLIWSFVVSCGTQQSESLVVVEPGGHVGRSLAGLSTCPRGGSSQRLS